MTCRARWLRGFWAERPRLEAVGQPAECASAGEPRATSCLLLRRDLPELLLHGVLPPGLLPHGVLPPELLLHGVVPADLLPHGVPPPQLLLHGVPGHQSGDRKVRHGDPPLNRFKDSAWGIPETIQK
jgi:hypothetical protein